MPSSFTRKRARDKKLLSHWDRCDEAHFARFNMSRDIVKATQLQLQGHIVLPGDPDYDQDRLLFYRNFNSYPTMIIYCAVESDVAIALQLAQQSSLAFTVRSGGHCTAGFSASTSRRSVTASTRPDSTASEFSSFVTRSISAAGSTSPVAPASPRASIRLLMSSSAAAEGP